MTVLVTGPNGFVGSRIMCAIPDAVPCPTLRNADQEQICRIIDRIKPDIIVNTSAISDIGVCERNPDASYAANVMLPIMLAKAANGAKLINFSSDQVYSGCIGPGPYREGDSFSPANVYARHKLEAEAKVLDIQPDAVMLRATWMYDMNMYEDIVRDNFLLSIMKSAISGRTIYCSKEEYRGITYVHEVAENILELADIPGGAYNFGSENNMSMYDTAKALLEALGANTGLLNDAQGGHNLQMDCGKLSSYGVRFNSTADGLRKCVADYGLNS